MINRMNMAKAPSKVLKTNSGIPILGGGPRGAGNLGVGGGPRGAGNLGVGGGPRGACNLGVGGGPRGPWILGGACRGGGVGSIQAWPWKRYIPSPTDEKRLVKKLFHEM